jgi:hypothetical protein
VGVTIHFEGRPRESSALGRVVASASRFAVQAGWQSEAISDSDTRLSRVRGEKPWDYREPTEGLTLYPHEWCEPVRLEFDRDGYVQEFVKTQYAPATVHVRVVDLLHLLADEFESLEVDDEGEYWDTSDVVALERHIDACNRALADILRTTPAARGPVRLPSGRIVDYMS